MESRYRNSGCRNCSNSLVTSASNGDRAFVPGAASSGTGKIASFEGFTRDLYKNIPGRRVLFSKSKDTMNKTALSRISKYAIGGGHHPRGTTCTVFAATYSP